MVTPGTPIVNIIPIVLAKRLARFTDSIGEPGVVKIHQAHQGLEGLAGSLQVRDGKAVSVGRYGCAIAGPFHSFKVHDSRKRERYGPTYRSLGKTNRMQLTPLPIIRAVPKFAIQVINSLAQRFFEHFIPAPITPPLVSGVLQ